MRGSKKYSNRTIYHASGVFCAAQPGCNSIQTGILQKMKLSLPTLLLSTAILMMSAGKAQGYQALNGSAYTGSTAIFNNPAASVNSAYRWDLTIFSVQAKVSNNSAYLQSSAGGGSTIAFRQDFNSKFLHANVDAGLFNFLYKIAPDKAFSIGVRLRSYDHLKTLPVNITDTMGSIHSFLMLNQNTPFVEGFATHNAWMETNLNYSQVLMQDHSSRLTGGITLHITKGMSGAYVKLNKVSYLVSKNATDTLFNFTNGTGAFAYSAGHDEGSYKDFNATTVGGLGLSAGIEYMTFNNEITNGNNHPLNYDWKIGVSLMDLGSSTYKPSVASAEYYDPKSTATDINVDQKLNNAPDIKAFKDSLKTLFNNSRDITENFSISSPTRLIVNVDKNMGDHLFINAELSMNFFSSASYTKLRTRELNLLTITPRWETIGLGAYLPIQYNTQGQLWMGAAIKLGPLVLGIHNLGILKKNALLNGGGYLLLSIHPFSKRRILDHFDCPQ